MRTAVSARLAGLLMFVRLADWNAHLTSVDLLDRLDRAVLARSDIPSGALQGSSGIARAFMTLLDTVLRTLRGTLLLRRGFERL
jgi:hypothetical protein